MSLNILRELAVGTEVPQITPDDAVGNKFIQDWEAEEHKTWDKWQTHSDNWEFVPNNITYYWNQTLNLHPEGPVAAKKKIIGDVRTKVQSLESDTARKNYISDNIHTWDDWLIREMEGFFFNSQDKEADRDLERARILARTEAKGLLSGLQGTPSPDRSVEAHANDVHKLLNAGYTSISFDKGFASAPINGELVAAFTLPDNTQSVTDSFISTLDIKPLVRNRVSDLVETSRLEAKKSDDTATRSLYQRIGTDTVPEEMTTNLILDKLEVDGEYNINDVYGGLEKLMNQKTESDAFTKPGQAAVYYISKINEIKSKFQRRLL